MGSLRVPLLGRKHPTISPYRNHPLDLTQVRHTMTQPTELQVLKARATQLNIPFSANIGLDTLKAKVHAFLNDLPEPVEKGEPAPVRTVKTNPNLYVPT